MGGFVPFRSFSPTKALHSHAFEVTHLKWKTMLFPRAAGMVVLRAKAGKTSFLLACLQTVQKRQGCLLLCSPATRYLIKS